MLQNVGPLLSDHEDFLTLVSTPTKMLRTGSSRGVSYILIPPFLLTDSIKVVLHELDCPNDRKAGILACTADTNGHPKSVVFLRSLLQSRTALCSDSYQSIVDRLAEQVNPWFADIRLDMLK